MYTNLMSVKRDLIGELHSSGLHRPDMIKSCDDVLNFLDKLYTQLLTKGGDVEGVGGVVSGNMVSVAPYTKNSFLSPKKIEVMIQDVNNNIIDLPMYLMVVNDILVYEGKYKVTPGDRKKIKENFKDILDNIPQNMREWLTNVNMLTLRHVSRDVYSENINILGPKCGNVYLKVLEKLG
jgi:DNA-binding cell septation regulator SpoVG